MAIVAALTASFPTGSTLSLERKAQIIILYAHSCLLPVGQGAAKGRKVLYIWDRAGIDFRQWFQWKNQSGIYFLSREKDNMKLEVVGTHPFDPTLPVNTGILADQMVATTQGVNVRRVIYQAPETRIIHHYLTNLPATIPPGLIAHPYKARCDIE